MAAGQKKKAFFAFLGGKNILLAFGKRGDRMKIGLIGAGRAGTALGLYFVSRRLAVSGFYSRTAQSAEQAASLCGTSAFTSLRELTEHSDVLFLTVPDRALAEVDREAAKCIRALPEGKITCCLHVSGAYPSDCLEDLGTAGCPVGSMHPLQSFGGPEQGAKQLCETYFSIEGTLEAVGVMETILQKTGNRYSQIPPGRKHLYHAGACLISNYLTTVLHSGMRCLEASGMDGQFLNEAIRPLAESALKNVWEKGTVDALTGPVSRGDIDTVRAHLETMEEALPEELEFYKAAARRTVEMIRGRRLTEEQGKRFEALLEGEGNHGR